MHDLARLARLDDEAAARARALAYEVAVNSGGCEEDRDRAARRVSSAVREHEDRVLRRARGARPACRAGRAPSRDHGRPGSSRTGTRAWPTRKRSGGSARSFSRSRGSSTGWVIATRRACSGDSSRQVPLRADGCAEAHHEGLALRVDRGVGDLGEVLLEVGREQLRPIGERGERRVDAHRAHGLLALDRHRRDHEPQVLSRVPEQPLQPLELGRRRLHGLAVRRCPRGRSSARRAGRGTACGARARASARRRR